MSMRIYNKNGVSSSLATTVREAHWNKRGEGNNGKLAIVPVITLSSLLRSIPTSAKTSLLLPDMQGFDFTAVKEGADVLKERVTHIVTKKWKDDTHTYNARNDLCRDWMPLMEELGEFIMNFLSAKRLYCTI